MGLVLQLGALLLAGYALVELVLVARTSGPAFPAAGKLTKGAWAAILAVALLVALGTASGRLSGLGIFSLASLVAVIVFWVDVRPALREVSGNGPR